MAKWVIDTTSDAKYEAKWGEGEFTRRKMTAEGKAQKLKNWQERMLMSVQFESIAMQLSQEQFEKAAKWPPNRWAQLVYKLAGVDVSQVKEGESDVPEDFDD